MSTLPDALSAVTARIERMGESAGDYDVIGILDVIGRDYGVTVADVNDLDFLRLLSLHRIEDRTDLPCPQWCTRGSGHPFESESHDGVQSRPHGTKLPIPVFLSRDPIDVYLSLVQEDERRKGDDGTAVRLRPEVSFAVDASFQSDELRKLAATLLNAADELDKVTGDLDQWTEDQL